VIPQVSELHIVGWSIDLGAATSIGTVMPRRSRGKHMSAVVHAANEFVELGLISADERNALMSAAAQSSCGQ